MSKETYKITFIHYQRNGVSGIGFYTFYVDYKTGKETVKMIVTAEPENGDNDCKIRPDQCRAITPGSPLQSWRGDEIAYQINKELSNIIAKHNLKNIYDIIEKRGGRP